MTPPHLNHRMTHEQKIAEWIKPGLVGTEIGPGQTPIPGLSPAPIYVDRFAEFGGKTCLADYHGDACCLPFHSNSLDYVASSHVLEHVANPVAALLEWYRVVRPGGIIYAIVPNRLATWDHTRQLTPVSHLLEDYERGMTAADATHIDEFVNELDWSRYRPDIPAENLPAEKTLLARGMHEAVGRGEEINIHFHTFEPSNFKELIETLDDWPRYRVSWELLDLVDGFPAASPNGILAVIRAVKGWSDRAEADAFDSTALPNRRAAVVRQDARRREIPAT
jgi:SAM-dependent methyltransferase